jgi:hypothetical protein
MLYGGGSDFGISESLLMLGFLLAYDCTLKDGCDCLHSYFDDILPKVMTSCSAL